MRTIYGAAVVVIISCIASFSVGDELGFAESIGNVEGGRRRALNYRTGLPSNVGVLPANYQSNVPHNRNGQRVKMQPPNRIATMAPTYKRAVPHPAMLQGPSNGMTQVLPPGMMHGSYPLMTQAISPMMMQTRPIVMKENEQLSPGMPPFKPIPMPEKKTDMQPRPFQPAVSQQNFTFMQTLPMKPISQNIIGNEGFTRPSPVYRPDQPPAVSRISSGNIVEVDNQHLIQQDDLPKVDLMGHSVEELAAAANVSVEAIKYAIHMRQQQLLADRRRTEILRNKILQEIMATKTTTTTTTTTSTTTTTPAPTSTPPIMPTKSVTSRPFLAGQKVMNAPKEYYPAGYEKNFDDNFQSKVDLPPTSFHCGDQKHFPGLYADMDLGCMVFHVCALTDDGLIMKSFLCPESTLFDQTVLKCNWWFYVECKNSKDLYDSNIPISKSYQLMKSLSYFSNYKKSNAKDLEALENAVSDDDDNKT